MLQEQKEQEARLEQRQKAAEEAAAAWQRKCEQEAAAAALAFEQVCALMLKRYLRVKIKYNVLKMSSLAMTLENESDFGRSEALLRQSCKRLRTGVLLPLMTPLLKPSKLRWSWRGLRRRGGGRSMKSKTWEGGGRKRRQRS